MLLQRVTFKNKNKNSANPVQRTLTDVDINQIKTKLNNTIDKINSAATDDYGNYQNYYTKEETENLINRQSNQIIERLSESINNIPANYINQLNFDLDTLVNKIENLD